MLIKCHRLTDNDIEIWDYHAYQDRLNAKILQIEKHRERAIFVINKFIDNKCYASISWGKDSTVIAHLIASANINVPLVWIKVKPIFNPECELVRDAFLKLYPNVVYHEIEVECPIIDGKAKAKKTLESGFKMVEKSLDTNYRISGIRGQESGVRKLRQKLYGVESKYTLAPITYWSALMVFVYLNYYDVPTHPAYAMTHGGLFDREYLRVASIGGKRGSNFDRTTWEKMYYPEILNLND